MKKILIATFALAIVSVNAKASTSAKHHSLFIPAVVESSFDESFPDVAAPNWSLDNQFMKATFVENNVSTNAYFTTQGDLVGTTKAASFTDLPAKAQEHITNKYKDYKVNETIFFIDNDTDNESAIFNIPDSQANYFVSLINGTKELILQVDKNGQTSFYEEKKI